MIDAERVRGLTGESLPGQGIHPIGAAQELDRVALPVVSSDCGVNDAHATVTDHFPEFVATGDETPGDGHERVSGNAANA